MESAWVMPAFERSPYPAAFAASLLIGFAVVYVILRKQGHPRNLIGYSIALTLATSLYGAKMYGVVVSGFRETLWDSGVASLGGAIGLLLGLFLMGRIYREGRRDLWQAFCLVTPLMYAVAKIGCFLVGCCHGIPYRGPMAVEYRNAFVQTGPVFPVQLLESTVFLLIFLAGLRLFRKRSEYLIPCLILLCAAAKFTLEYLREEHIGRGITANQWVCAAFAVGALIRVFRRGGEK